MASSGRSEARTKWFGGSEYKDYLAHAILLSAYKEVALFSENENHDHTERIAEAQLSTCLSESVKSKLIRKSRSKDENSPVKPAVSMHKIEERVEIMLNNLIELLGCKNSAEAKKFLSETVQFNKAAAKTLQTLNEQEADIHRKFAKMSEEINEELAQAQLSFEEQRLNAKLEADIVLKRSEALELRSQLLELEILSELYSEEKVKALEQVSNHLEREIRSAEGELKTLEQNLAQYKALGPEFHAIVSEYRNVKKVIESNEFVLYNLNDSDYAAT